jgi:hypothetical protein
VFLKVPLSAFLKMVKQISKTAIKTEALSKNIIKLLGSQDKPLSTTDLSNELGKAWHTIDRACLMLLIEKKIEGFKVGKMNLWRLK